MTGGDRSSKLATYVHFLLGLVPMVSDFIQIAAKKPFALQLPLELHNPPICQIKGHNRDQSGRTDASEQVVIGKYVPGRVHACNEETADAKEENR